MFVCNAQLIIGMRGQVIKASDSQLCMGMRGSRFLLPAVALLRNNLGCADVHTRASASPPELHIYCATKMLTATFVLS